jgi:hypothetical protein
MNGVQQYWVVRATSVIGRTAVDDVLSNLTNQVDELIKQGWQPNGGVAFTDSGNSIVCAQAIVLPRS